MGKSTEPPTCRFCGKQHRGTCMDHEARGAISSQADVREQRIAKATEVIASVKPKAKKSTAARKDVRKPDPRPLVGVQQPGGEIADGHRRVTPSTSRTKAGAPASDAELAASQPAGTQAPPVDTIATKGRGRPKLHPDRKAYLAEKARERRAKLKADRPEQTNRGK